MDIPSTNIVVSLPFADVPLNHAFQYGDGIFAKVDTFQFDDDNAIRLDGSIKSTSFDDHTCVTLLNCKGFEVAATF